MLGKSNLASALICGIILLAFSLGADDCGPPDLDDLTAKPDAGPAGDAQGGDASIPPRCMDKVKNDKETDVDCSGSCPNKCDNGQACTINGDCQSGTCTGSKCQDPTCANGVQSESETDIDCGGNCGSTCDDGKNCMADADCKSGVCSSNQCQAPTCFDNVQNGGETGKDCDGPCTLKCYGETCAVNGDCNSNACGGGLCRFAFGVKCTEGTECASNFCAPNGTCTICSADDQCKSNKCDVPNGKCMIEDGAPCGLTDSVCLNKTCTNGLCALTNGDNCANAAQCRSHVCNSTNNKCGVCSKDADCSASGGSGQCDEPPLSGNCFLPDDAYCDPLSTGQCIPGSTCDGFPPRCHK